MKRFLKAKHWQIFLMTFGIPFLFQIISMLSLIISKTPLIMITIMPIVMIIFIVCFFGWFWSVAIGLQSKIPKDIKMKVKKFKIFFIIPMIYIFFLLGFMGFMFSNIIGGYGLNPSIFALIVPLHLFSMFCIFYCLYFVAKTFKTVELQREVSFSDFAGEFFMIWFFPVGIWIIQPKINKMVETEIEEQSTTA